MNTKEALDKILKYKKSKLENPKKMDGFGPETLENKLMQEYQNRKQTEKNDFDYWDEYRYRDDIGEY